MAFMEVLNRLQEYFDDSTYEFVLLFGSYSNDTNNALSDIDIGVYFQDSVDYLELGYHIAKLETIFNLKIDMIALNDIYKQNPLFGFEILKNHKPIIINNQEKYIEFKTKSQLYYLDAKPLIEQNRASLKQRIANNTFGERDFAR
jgi:predicted nucleotidyltransferase